MLQNSDRYYPQESANRKKENQNPGHDQAKETTFAPGEQIANYEHADKKHPKKENAKDGIENVHLFSYFP